MGTWYLRLFYILLFIIILPSCYLKQSPKDTTDSEKMKYKRIEAEKLNSDEELAIENIVRVLNGEPMIEEEEGRPECWVFDAEELETIKHKIFALNVLTKKDCLVMRMSRFQSIVYMDKDFNYISVEPFDKTKNVKFSINDSYYSIVDGVLSEASEPVYPEQMETLKKLFKMKDEDFPFGYAKDSGRGEFQSEDVIGIEYYVFGRISDDTRVELTAIENNISEIDGEYFSLCLYCDDEEKELDYWDIDYLASDKNLFSKEEKEQLEERIQKGLTGDKQSVEELSDLLLEKLTIYDEW